MIRALALAPFGALVAEHPRGLLVIALLVALVARREERRS